MYSLLRIVWLITGSVLALTTLAVGADDYHIPAAHHSDRWVRHCLDLARFAESNGYEFDEVRPNAWRYRDYVIRSFNADKPYDRFVKEQLAGDELYPGDADALVATGFNLLGPD